MQIQPLNSAPAWQKTLPDGLVLVNDRAYVASESSRLFLPALNLDSFRLLHMFAHANTRARRPAAVFHR